MDKNPLISRLNKALPGAVLEVRRFGRSSVSSIWVETQSIQKVADFLINDLESKLDWLENLSAVEFEGVFVLTYFLRSTVTKQVVAVRLSIIPTSENETVTLPSVQQIWPMAIPMQQDVTEMFGLKFQSSIVPEFGRLPAGWEGFPLRKNYVFPQEVMGISHFRPFINRSTEKKSFE